MGQTDCLMRVRQHPKSGLAEEPGLLRELIGALVATSNISYFSLVFNYLILRGSAPGFGQTGTGIAPRTAALCVPVKQSEGVRFAALFARPPPTARDGNAAIQVVWDTVLEHRD